MKTFASLFVTLLLASPVLAAEPTIRSIELPQFLDDLPPGPDRELFASRCLSCHSTRYITMQPVVPAAKWEENIKKMIKTYGAPIGEDEVPRLLQYVLDMQKIGPQPLARTLERDAKMATPDGKKVDLERGKQLYATACASCHGAAGKGDGQNMGTLLPRATDLTEGRYAPAAVEAAIVRGVRGTAMPSFPTLSDDDVSAVVAYTVQLGAPAQSVSMPAEQVAAAKAIFDSACVSCHGSGAGDGFNAPALPRLPTSFRLRQPSAARAASVIAEGVPGTAMPAWKAKFDERQRSALSDYVRSLHQE